MAKKQINSGANEVEVIESTVRAQQGYRNKRGKLILSGQVIKVPTMTKEKARDRVIKGVVHPGCKEWHKFINRGWFTHDEMMSLGGHKE